MIFSIMFLSVSVWFRASLLLVWNLICMVSSHLLLVSFSFFLLIIRRTKLLWLHMDLPCAWFMHVSIYIMVVYMHIHGSMKEHTRFHVWSCMYVRMHQMSILTGVWILRSQIEFGPKTWSTGGGAHQIRVCEAGSKSIKYINQAASFPKHGYQSMGYLALGSWLLFFLSDV